jgi:SNF2 family DNA or RNA helicase
LLNICPNSVKETWGEQIDRWIGNRDNLSIWGSKAYDHKKKWLVINYEALIAINGSSAVAQFIRRGKFFMIVDESHRIKNPTATTSKAVRSLAQLAARVRLLSGTPMTNSVMDLYPQGIALGEFKGMTAFQFRARYARMGGYLGKQVVGINPDNEEELRRRMARVSFRARKKDWLDLPEALYSVRNFEMTKEQLKVYREMSQEFITMVGNEEISADMVISQRMKMQQISRGFALKDGAVHNLFDDPEKNPAIRVVMETIEDCSGKIIVFTVHREAFNTLRTVLGESWGTAYLGGGMKTEEVNNQKQYFNDDPKCKILVAQISAGSEGHTLLGDVRDEATRCGTTLFYENSYNLKDRMQGESRNHRMGQTGSVLYIDLNGSSMDGDIIKALQSKHDLVQAIVDGIKKEKVK